MMKLSQMLRVLTIGNPAEAAAVSYLKNVTINSTTGVVSTTAGNDLIVTNNPTSITPTGQLKASKVWNAVWNDIADFQQLNDELIPGKAYYDTIEGARICTQRCQMGFMGLATDTFGMSVGSDNNYKQVPIAVCGWVLAYVDQEYPIGTALTNDESGKLTAMTDEEKMKYPERLAATYKKKEHKDLFGTETQKIKVNGRHWVKVK